MTVWLACNGYRGSGYVGVLVEAETEEDARTQAEAALRADGRTGIDGDLDEYATIETVRRLDLPVVGEFDL